MMCDFMAFFFFSIFFFLYIYIYTYLFMNLCNDKRNQHSFFRVNRAFKAN